MFLSSAGARMGVGGQTVYAATKAANESFTRVWAKELGQKYGVTVNAVNPGPIATGKSFPIVRAILVLACQADLSQINGFKAMRTSLKKCSH